MGAQLRRRWHVAKPEWGTKRSCQSCGTKFYDLRKPQIVCPKCGAEFDPQLVSRPQRPRPAAAPAPKPAEAVELEGVEVELDEEVIEDEAEEEDEVIEDASELGGDKDDMFEIEKPEGEDER